MDWSLVYNLIPDVVESIRNEYIVNNPIIKDDIFRILEKHCIVVYYPIPEETKSRGFHTRRYLHGELMDFVFINTANETAEQIFAAAHELGHVWGVADKVWEKAGFDEELTEENEEKIIGRFAAELLMPATEFKKTFWAHIKDLKLNPNRIRREELIRVMVMQMTDYMVPYEAIRRRLYETSIVSKDIGERLCADNDPWIKATVEEYLKDLNTPLAEASNKKTIPGLRDLLTKAESCNAVSEYVLSKIKKDFSLEDISTTEQIIHLFVEDK